MFSCENLNEVLILYYSSSVKWCFIYLEEVLRLLILCCSIWLSMFWKAYLFLYLYEADPVFLESRSLSLDCIPLWYIKFTSSLVCEVDLIYYALCGGSYGFLVSLATDACMTRAALLILLLVRYCRSSSVTFLVKCVVGSLSCDLTSCLHLIVRGSQFRYLVLASLSLYSTPGHTKPIVFRVGQLIFMWNP